MLNNLTHSRLHDLGLNGMARALALQLEQPQMSQLMFEERLGLLLDAEISSRDTCMRVIKLDTKSFYTPHS